MRWPRFYFGWLQKDAPTGTIDRFPALQNTFDTSVQGLYCVGDLTGIPLIKLAAESGYALIERLKDDAAFQKQREARTDDEVLDLVIVGAGPAGVSACLHAAELGMKHVVIESSQMFNTIHNFPAGKPIYVTPEGPIESDLVFSDGTKESLLEELEKDVEGKPLPVRDGEMVKQITKNGSEFSVETSETAYRSLAVIVAIGKTGNARRLGVPGEDLPKVFTRLIDPGHHNDEDVLVVGGGDSAIEAAIALAREGNRVTLSYRKPALSRPKAHNVESFDALVASGDITPLFESTVKEIRGQEVVVGTTDGEKVLPNSAVYGLIGSEIPVAFFKRSGIKMEGERGGRWWLELVTLVSFFTMLYFGKAGRALDVFAGRTSPAGRLLAYLTAPFSSSLSWALTGQDWYGSLNFVLGWLGSLVFIVSGLALLAGAWRRRSELFGSTWNRIKYAYFLFVAVFFTAIYFRAELAQEAGWAEGPTFWYSLFYTTTILLFGIRRVQLKPTGYIIAQTATLAFIQTFFLFILPFLLYDGLLVKLFSGNSWLLSELFPSGKWSSFAYILFWPLNINEFGNSVFWTWFPFVQTFGILLLIVYLWGKGAYCGWICSCGAMAETLGDEYRTLAPHGEKAKKLDNIGQVVLWAAIACAALYVPYKLALRLGSGSGIPFFSETTWYAYKLLIDVVFAGVLGLGVYFFMGGRIWCRYGCPLAALMHIYTRFSPYRIMCNKHRCISCNICTKVCHMGIDVMGYANRGIPMNDVECVRCSACVVNCPMQVLTFGNIGGPDPDNVRYKDGPTPLTEGWRSGLAKKDIEMLLREADAAHGAATTEGGHSTL